MPTSPDNVRVAVDRVIRDHQEIFDSVETLRVTAEAELEKGQPNWEKPYIRVIARQPAVLRGRVPDNIEELPVRIIAATQEEQAARVVALRRSGITPSPDEVAADWRTGLISSGVEAPRDYSKLTYRPLNPTKLNPVNKPMELILHVSPDAGWPTLEAFLEPAQSWVIAMYDFTAPHIVGRVKQAAASGNVRLCLGPGEALDKNPSPGSTKANDLHEKDTVANYQATFGERFEFAWASVGLHRQFASAYHIKVAVRDGEAFWLSSGNWQRSNQPSRAFADEGEQPAPEAAREMARYNREWHVIAKSRELAGIFEEYINKDFETAEAEAVSAPGALPQADEAAAQPGEDTGTQEDEDYPSDDEFTLEMRLPVDPGLAEVEAPRLPRRAWKPKILPLDATRSRKVQPILTPDNYTEHALPLIQGAQHRLWFQNQSLAINQFPNPNYRALLDALKAKSWELADCRIIFRDIFRPDTLDALRLLKRDGFNMEKVKVMSDCHTKGILVDSRWALIGSHNWTNEGTQYNRDASLLFDDPEVNTYFEPIVEHDWQYLAFALEVDLETPSALVPLPAEDLPGTPVVKNARLSAVYELHARNVLRL